jgi:hypothetical protein
MKRKAQRQTLQAPVTPETERPLSPARAFVVQFRDGGEATDQRFTGRVEHMTSGHAARFDSADELLAFFRRMMNAPRIHPSEER